jgi:hypothetical protein
MRHGMGTILDGRIDRRRQIDHDDMGQKSCPTRCIMAK